jgi:hypothetical protein
VNGPRIEGTLKLEASTYSLELNGFCFAPRSLDIQPGSIAISDDPAAVTADFAPRTIYGQLDNGHRVTLLGAHMDMDLFAHVLGPLTQRFTGHFYSLAPISMAITKRYMALDVVGSPESSPVFV